MFRPLANSHRRPPRRGTSFILIVVVMLSLFSAVGTAYALFAMREARLALARKNEQGGGTSPPLTAPDPTDTINRFFSVLIYDTDDNDITNSLRGHSFARSMYGHDTLAFSVNPAQPPTAPWSGVGLFHEDTTSATGPYGLYAGGGLPPDRASCVNYTVMTIAGKPFLLDPEYMGPRPLDTSGNLQPFSPRTYVSKAAGYSYPDLKDFFLAAYDPATGQVLAPSFHRDWLFGGPMAPNNPNWTNATGRLQTLRPRPAEHPKFPRVPPNPDGSYTGDVQNLPGGVGPQKNDSIWIDMGLPVITLPGGKKVKPLVAPLILPVNGLLNASAHGNTYYGGNHGSLNGLGPWEVNLGALLGANDANNVVGLPPNTGANTSPSWTGRGAPQQRNGLNSRAFAPYRAPVLSSDAAVVWGWSNSPASMPTYPNTNPLAGAPIFAAPYFQTDNGNNPPWTNHPSLFNPTEWPGRSLGYSNRTYPLGDLKRFNLRYADTQNWYSQADLNQIPPSAPPRLFPSQYPFVLATGQQTANAYRLDPSHSARGLLTTTGYDLDRPKLTPLYVNRGSLSMNTNGGQLKPTNLSPGAYPQPQAGAANALAGDFVSPLRWTSAVAALGAVDLNRALSDYRGANGTPNVNQPLSPTNITNQAQADFDRRKLAHDIFVRLAVATGAALNVNPTPVEYPQYQYSVPGTIVAGTAQYDALRYLAQLAVNIVDYIDNDDISTVFVWNPTTIAGTDPAIDPTNFAAGQVGNRVVFGAERSRLVINEAYAEIVNHPNELETNDTTGGTPNAPKQPVGGSPAPAAHIRFWLELVNPTNPLTNATGPIGNGAAPLWQANGGFSPYQIEIARANRQNTSDATQVGVTWDATTIGPANTTGGWKGGLKPDIAFQFTNAVASVAPNNGQYSPAPRPNGGFVVLGPPVNNAKTDEFNPAVVDITSPAPQDNAVTPQASLAYAMPLPKNTADMSSTEYRQHTVLLRRAVNPYLRPNDPTVTTGSYPYQAGQPLNPYVTVDVMENVPAFDAVHRENSATRGNTRGQRNGMNGGYDPPQERFAVGKVQPYAGQSVLSVAVNGNPGGYNQYTFPASMVLPQKVGNMTTPQHTLGRHNGTGNAAPANSFTAGNPPKLGDTIMTPFDWLVHPDRNLINQLELLQVRDTPPHRVTQQFVVGNGTNAYAPAAGTGPGVTYDTGSPRWIDDGFARALELLTVKPYTSGVAHGGRVPGKVNVNALSDQRVLMGLMDPQGGNLFDPNFVTNTAWQQWVNSRTPVQPVPTANPATQPVNRTQAPSQTVFETGANTFSGDRPFLPLGAPVVSAGTFAYTAGGNVDGNAALPSNADLTILRRTATANPPLLYGNQTSKAGLNYNPTGPLPSGPSYFRAEPARKIFNNLTTVNHQYMVFLTIGYFDIDTQNGPLTLAPNVTVPRLGAESYINVPGDMRQKAFGIVDMSNMALDPDPTKPFIATRPATLPAQYAWQPFFTSLEATAYGNGTGFTPTNGPLTIAYTRYDAANQMLYVGADGQEVPITVGSMLVIGYGVEQQVVTVTGVPAPGQVTVATATINGVQLPFRTAWAGTCVSNVRPGYPGDISRLSVPFDVNSETYKPVLPYYERLK